MAPQCGGNFVGPPLPLRVFAITFATRCGCFLCNIVECKVQADPKLPGDSGEVPISEWSD